MLEMTVKKVEDILKNRDQGMLSSAELEGLQMIFPLAFSEFMFRPALCTLRGTGYYSVQSRSPISALK